MQKIKTKIDTIDEGDSEMNDEQWDRVIDQIDAKFGIKDKGVEKVERTKTEWFIFEHPSGEIKIERVSRPIIIEEKRIYTKRPGTQATVEPVYSDTEFSHRVNLYVREGDTWRPVDFKAGMSLF